LEIKTKVDRYLRTSAIASALLARQYGINITTDAIEGKFENNEIKSPKDLEIYFQTAGIKISNFSLKAHEFLERSYLFPCIAPLKDGKSLIIASVKDNKQTQQIELSLIDPLDPTSKINIIPLSEFTKLWTNEVVSISRYTGHISKDRVLDRAWFTPEFYRFKWLIFLAFIMSIIVHGLALSPIIYIQVSLDKVLGYNATSTLYVLTAAVSLALIFNGILNYARDYIVTYISTTIEARMVGDVFDKLLELPVNKYQLSEPGTLESGVTATSNIRNFINRQILSNIFDATGILVFVPVLFGYSPILALVVIGFSILSGLISLFMKKRENVLSIILAKIEREKGTVLRETITGIDAVKSFSLEGRQRNAWRTSSAESIRQYQTRSNHTNLTAAISSVLQQLMTVAIIFTGISLVFAGSMSAGAIISSNMLGGKITAPIKQIIMFFIEANSIKSAFNNMADIWNSPTERAGTGGQRVIKGNYKLTDVSILFEDGKALNEISLDIKENTKIGIVGPAASGKSTVLRLLQGLLKPNSGTMTIDSIHLNNINLENYRSQVGLVTITPTFFHGTIEDNLRRTRPNISEREFEDALNWSGLSTIMGELANGLATEIDQFATNLSSSHRIIIAIARALVSNPKVLLFDETISHLDKKMQKHVRENLINISRGRTFILATHDLQSLTTFDNIIVLKGGKVEGADPHSKLLTNCPTYIQLWSLETELTST
jgi:ABC-type bacteriocin/lantibiotic exporter with double-glycine peptidase domain